MHSYQTLLADLPLLHVFGLPVDELHSFYERKTCPHIEGMGEPWTMVNSIDGPSLSLNGLIALAGGSPFASSEKAKAEDKATSVDESGLIGTGKSELTEEEQREVEELKERDREVRRHEQAHKAAAGRYASGAPSFEYEVGPDGQRYVVGGEVSIDVSPVADDPQATIDKMRQVRAAATAPAEPSSQDRQVAAEAAQLEQQARADLAIDKSEEASTDADTNADPLRPESIISDSALADASTPTGKFIDAFA